MARTIIDKLHDRLNEVAGIERIETLLYEARGTEGDTTRLAITRERNPELLVGTVGGGLDQSLIDRRQREGDDCYIVTLDDGGIAHYSWVKRGGEIDLMEAGKKEPVANGDFWIYHCWTEPWARGRGIYPAALRSIMAQQFESGMHRCCIYTLRDNVASQKGIAKAGFHYTDSLQSIRIGRLYLPLTGSRTSPLAVAQRS